ncbi:MAG: glycosyltransferase [Roseiarcus sp.]
MEASNGVDAIHKPSIEQLHTDGARIEGVFVDRTDRHNPLRRNPDYYIAVDALVCVSEIDGIRNPVLDAAACGAPVISTNVGIAPEVSGPKQPRFILEERSVSALKDAILRLLAEGILLFGLSEEILKLIKHWDSSIRRVSFRKFLRLRPSHK